MNKFFSNFGFWIFLALFIGWRVWDNYTTPASEKINEMIAAAAIFIIFIITMVLVSFFIKDDSKKTTTKPATKLPATKQTMKNSFTNPGTKLSDLANSPLGQSMSKFIRDRNK